METIPKSMNNWNLKFKDPQTEREFNESCLELDLKAFRFSMILGFITYILFLSLDYVLYNESIFHKFILLRLSIAAVVMAAYFSSFRIIKTPKQYQTIAIFIAIICFFVHVAFTFFQGDDNFYFYTANLILITFIFNFLNIRFFNLIFVGTFYIVAHLLLLYFNFEFVTETFLHQTYGIISVVAVSWLGIRIMESQKREDFLNKRLIESQKMALENSVKEQNDLLLMLKERNEELDAFNHSVSHDLKTPLRNVSTFSKLLERRYKNQLDDNALEYLDFIVNGTKKMNTLIDDLLEYSKIRQTELRLEPLNMDVMVETIFLEFTQSLAEKPCFTTNELPSVNGDKILIKQVWDNLISNAVKYSSKTTKAEITVGAMTTANEVTYYIKDNGIGFDMKFADRLFELFSRLHSDQEYVGTGVGLSLVDRIIKKHNGKIWAESQPNVGSTFYFSLPIK